MVLGEMRVLKEKLMNCEDDFVDFLLGDRFLGSAEGIVAASFYFDKNYRASGGFEGD